MSASAIELVEPNYDESKIAACLPPGLIEKVKLRSTVSHCSDETFLVMAQNCLKEKAYYRECDKEYFGRIRNAIMNENVDTVVTSGAMLDRLFVMASEQVPVRLAANESYQVQYDMFQSLLERAVKNVSFELPESH